MYLNIYVCIYTYIFTHIYVHIYVCICMCVYILDVELLIKEFYKISIPDDSSFSKWFYPKAEPMKILSSSGTLYALTTVSQQGTL